MLLKFLSKSCTKCLWGKVIAFSKQYGIGRHVWIIVRLWIMPAPSPVLWMEFHDLQQNCLLR